MLRKCLDLDFSSSFSFFSLISVKTPYKWCWTPSPQPPTPIYSKMKGGGCMTARPGELVASTLSFLMGPSGPKGWKMSPKWPFCPSFEHFTHFLPKRHKTLRIARRLVLSSSIQPARTQISTNDRPRTKLGYDSGFGIFENLRHYPITKLDELDYEHCFVLILRVHPNLVVSWVSIEKAKKSMANYCASNII